MTVADSVSLPALSKHLTCCLKAFTHSLQNSPLLLPLSCVKMDKGILVMYNKHPSIVLCTDKFQHLQQAYRMALKSVNPEARSALIIVIIPSAADELYATVKHYGDVVHGFATQCLVSSNFAVGSHADL